MLSDSYINALRDISKLLYDNDIHWSIGAGCLLYLHGYPVHPTDIDIVVEGTDIEKLQSAISTMNTVAKQPNEQFQTTYFYELTLYGIDIDIMVDFKIATSPMYTFPFSIEQEIKYQDIRLPLGSIQAWKDAYVAMNRLHTVAIIDDGPTKTSIVKEQR